MAKVKDAAGSPPPLEIGLNDPGMTPMMRAGLGGLAASLREMARHDKASQWPKLVRVGPGTASVAQDRISIQWGDGSREEVLRALFEGSFQIRKGLIFLPGMFGQGRIWNEAIGVGIQNALKQTFLQHGKSTEKAEGERVVTLELDTNLPVTVSLQPYLGFVHQTAWEDVATAFRSPIRLPGWAYPGAVGRHNGLSATELSYGAPHAIAVLFAIVGTLSVQVSGGGGALVIAEPEDLITFAELRPSLTPATVAGLHAAGATDAALSACVALAAASTRRAGVAAIHAVTLRSTPWASQQKSRVATATVLAPGDPAHERMLELYDVATRELPARIHVRSPEPKAAKPAKGRAPKAAGQAASGGYFIATSALRGFVADNIARGLPWFAGFATARASGNPPRSIHQVRQPGNLGALFPAEKEGLIAMIEKTDDPDKLLIESVHSALRHRFGAIYEETKSLPAQTRRNRMNGERERWRLVFAKAKTPSQVRAGLADLWSRAGTVPQLRERWHELLPLLHSSEWSRARDLSLVALASYRGKETVDAEAGETEENPDDVSDEHAG